MTHWFHHSHHCNSTTTGRNLTRRLLCLTNKDWMMVSKLRQHRLPIRTRHFALAAQNMMRWCHRWLHYNSMSKGQCRIRRLPFPMNRDWS